MFRNSIHNMQQSNIMKLFIIVFSIAAIASAPVFALSGGGARLGGSHSSTSHSYGGGSHSVRGYVKKNGTYVAPSRATNPNRSKYDNWSTKGNSNPYTGKGGTKDPVTGK